MIDLVDTKIGSPALRKKLLFTIKYISSAYNVWLKSKLVLATYGKFPPAHIFPTEEVLFNIVHNKDGIQQRLGIIEPLTLPCTSAGKAPDCSGFFFFNNFHPTTEVHRYLAQEIHDFIFPE